MARSIVALACAAALGAMVSQFHSTTGAEQSFAAQARNASGPATTQATQAAKKNMDVLEAVFRYQFDHNGSGAQKKAAAFFLSIDDKDPSPDFLARFKGDSPPVKPGSQFVVGKGVKFTAEGVRWIDDKTAEVKGGYYEGLLSSQSDNVYQATLKDGKWVVRQTMSGLVS